MNEHVALNWPGLDLAREMPFSLAGTQVRPAALEVETDGAVTALEPRVMKVLVALLRHRLHEGSLDPLEAESLALTLVLRSIGRRTTHAAGASQGRQRLVDRAKLVLMGDLARRWTLADVAAEVGVSAVYLTQSFREVEAVPLYRYQLRLRLARALDLLGEYEDLGTLGLNLGFSSHSHFSAAFQQAYGRTPSEFRELALQCRHAPADR